MCIHPLLKKEVCKILMLTLLKVDKQCGKRIYKKMKVVARLSHRQLVRFVLGEMNEDGRPRQEHSLGL